MAIESAALFLIAATVADELLSSETRPTIQFFVSVWFFDPSRDQPLPLCWQNDAHLRVGFARRFGTTPPATPITYVKV